MDILAGGQRGCWPRLVTGLPTTGDAAGDIGVSLRGVLRGDAHIDEVALDQNCGIDDVLIGSDDGKEGGVGRGDVDLAVEGV